MHLYAPGDTHHPIASGISGNDNEHIEVTVSPPGSFLLYVHPFTDPTGNTYDMSVQVSPEPATLSLLAIGGLAVLRRRRKQ